MTWLDALGWAGSALLVFSVVQTRILRLRVLNLNATLILLAFNVGIRVWPMVAMNAVLAVLNLVFIVRLLLDRRAGTSAYAVLEVRENDTYLRHFLATQRGDVAKYFPAFDPNATSDRTAYLIQHGHETAGVVMVRGCADGTAQIDLDYVTPAYRDLSPGEFLYRDSDLFRSKGFRRIVTPPGMVAPYYQKLGFTRSGDSWTLDLEGTRTA